MKESCHILRIAITILALFVLGQAVSISAQSARPAGRPTGGQAFSFVVIGNTPAAGQQEPGGEPGKADALFSRFIKQINLTFPDCVFNTGNIISKHCDGDDLIREYDAHDRAVAELLCPYYIVSGTHDLSDEPTDTFYTERYGPLRYSFNHKGAHFVVLGAEPGGQDGRISDAQLEWLEDDLAVNAMSKPRFLFLHRPLWRTGQKSANDVSAWWQNTVHPILKKYKVDCVFAGHRSEYLSENIEGIRYVTTGGGGRGLSRRQGSAEVLGRFHHYLIVTVRNGRPSILVAKLNGISPHDCITPEKIAAESRKRFYYDQMPTDFGTFEGKMLLAPGLPQGGPGAGHIWVEPKGGNPGSFVGVGMYYAHQGGGHLMQAGAGAVGKRISLPAKPEDILDVTFSVDYANWRTDRTPQSDVWLMVIPAESWDYAGGYVGPGDYDLSEPEPPLYAQQFSTEVSPDQFPSLEMMPRNPQRLHRGGQYAISWSSASADKQALLKALREDAGREVVFVVQARNNTANTRLWGHLDNIKADVLVRDGEWTRILTQ